MAPARSLPARRRGRAGKARQEPYGRLGLGVTTGVTTLDPILLSAGAARGIRTPDPRITNAVLYQLSYCGIA